MENFDLILFCLFSLFSQTFTEDLFSNTNQDFFLDSLWFSVVINQAFHSSANLRKTAFLALAENSASVNLLNGRIPENPRSHPIELPSLVQDSPVAIYQGCQDFRNSALGPN